MAYVDIYPSSNEAEAKMARRIADIRFYVRAAIKQEWDIAEHDIIVMAHKNTILSQDPFAVDKDAVPELVIKINTSDTELQNRAERLGNRIVSLFQVSFSDISMELWIGFFHTWGCTINFS